MKISKILFIYYDPDFSFSFGHYKNLLDILLLEYGSKKYNFFLINKEINKNYKNIKIRKTELIKFFNKNIKLFKKYSKIIIYSYKTELKELNKILLLSSIINKLNAKIYFNLFLFPHQLKKIKNNRSKLRRINRTKNIITTSDILYPNIRKYIRRLKLLYPPILCNNSYITKINNEKINILFFTGPFKNRYEDVSNDFINNLKQSINLDNLNIKIKANSDDEYHVNLADKKLYEDYLKLTDIAILLYDPKYYRFRTSGIFVECLKNNCIIICSDNLSFSKYVTSFNIGELYHFGNKDDLKNVISKVIDNLTYYKNNYQNNEIIIKNYINLWSLNYFKNFVK